MLTLPNRITYNVLKSFWTIFCILVLAVLSLTAVLITGSYMYFLLFLTVPLLIILGFKYPEMILRPYIYFNAVLKRIVRLLRYIVLPIFYYLVLVPMKLTGGKLQFAQDESMWKPKKIINIIGEKGDYDVSIDNSRHTIWITPMSKWIIKTRKWGLLTVIPFLFILSILSESEEEIEVATDTYTLY